MIWIYILFFFLFFIYEFFLLYFAILNNSDSIIEINSYPFISILIAARNEEEYIESCLRSLNKIDYPKDKLEVLIGDDNSEDTTASIVENFCKINSGFRLIRISKKLGNARGKANVLAHLAEEAKGDFFFITDADIEVSYTWIRALLGAFSPSDGIVSGVTLIKGNTWFAKMQLFDWIIGFGMVKTASDLRIPVSAVGNNMAIRREAYYATGGYANIPFSVTEDHELFNHTLSKGYTFKNLVDKKVLAFSKPVNSIKSLLLQRKRWMTGAIQLPFVLSFFLFLQALFFPVIIALCITHPVLGILLWFGKIVLQYSFVIIISKRLKWKTDISKYILLFELYSGIVGVAMLVYYVFPTGVYWKGRKY